MKIACVASDDLGTLIFCKTLSRLLAERGGVELFTISAVDKYRDELREVRSTHLDVKLDRSISPARDLIYLYRLYRIFRRERFGAVVTFATKPNIYGALAARLAGVPRVVIAVRGLGPAFDEPTTLKKRLVRLVVEGLYRLASRAAHLVWFTNINDQRSFVRQGIVREEKTFLTRNAVDLSDFSMGNVAPDRLEAVRAELGLGPDDMVVMMVGRLTWSKGVREFCEAAVALRDRLPNVLFVLVAPEEPASLNPVPPSYVHEMEARCRLRWLGFRKDIRELYAVSSIAVLVSYYREGGYPRALLEPMAFGKPVIAADTEDCRGPVEEGRNGYVVPPRDSAALATAIEAIASDPERRRAFGAHSLERVHAMFDDRPVFEELINRVLRDT